MAELAFDYVTVELARVSCGGCGLVFSVPAHWLKKIKEAGGSVACPNTRCPWETMHWGGSEVEKLKS